MASTIWTGPGRSMLAPTIAAVNAPAMNDPSTPMLKTPALKAIRVARPVMISGVAEAARGGEAIDPGERLPAQETEELDGRSPGPGHHQAADGDRRGEREQGS